jgi:hypothetical protein
MPFESMGFQQFCPRVFARPPCLEFRGRDALDGFLISPDTHHLTRAGAAHIGKIWFNHPLLTELR